MTEAKQKKRTKTPPDSDGKAPQLIDFESTLDELENLVEKMESGDLSLEASLEAFERGVKLTRDCQSTLKNAELRIQTLMQASEDIALADEPES